MVVLVGSRLSRVPEDVSCPSLLWSGRTRGVAGLRVAGGSVGKEGGEREV